MKPYHHITRPVGRYIYKILFAVLGELPSAAAMRAAEAAQDQVAAASTGTSLLDPLPTRVSIL